METMMIRFQRGPLFGVQILLFSLFSACSDNPSQSDSEEPVSSVQSSSSLEVSSSSEISSSSSVFETKNQTKETSSSSAEDLLSSSTPLSAEIPTPQSRFTAKNPLSFENKQAYQKPVRGNFLLRDLLWDSTEVTQGEFERLMNAKPWTSAPLESRILHLNDSLRPARLSFYQAALYANERSKELGFDTVYTWTSHDGWDLEGFSANLEANGFRIPLLDEWQQAYGSTRTLALYWTDLDIRDISIETPENLVEFGKYAWYGSTCFREYIETESGWETVEFEQDDPRWGYQRVGQLLPNKYGLYDMAGNLDEFVTNAADPTEIGFDIDAAGGDFGVPPIGLTGNVYFHPGENSNPFTTTAGLRLVQEVKEIPID